MQNTQPDPAGGWDVSDMRSSDGTNVDIRDSINPVFDVYRVTDTFPNLCELASTALQRESRLPASPGSVLGFPRSTQKFVYFNRLVLTSPIFQGCY